ncbi:unnamed protein product [Discula destructiva]
MSAVGQDKERTLTGCKPSADIISDVSSADGGAVARPETATGHEAEDNDSKANLPHTPFIPTLCLFCPESSPTFELNQSHMHKKHGLFLPLTIDNGARALAIDVETMVEYMHLVVFAHHECLFCGTQRPSSHAVRHHMMGKGHCRIDLTEPADDGDNEFRDFYELVDVEEGEEEEEGEVDSRMKKAGHDGESIQEVHRSATPSNLDDNTLRLASGKVLSHRSTPLPPRTNRRPLMEPKGHGPRTPDLLESLLPRPEPESETEPSTTTHAPSEQQALTRIERRALAHHKSALTVAISKMSTRDRAALAHLSPAEQRSMVVRQFKQQDQQAHAQRKYLGRMEGMGNQVLMKHFVSDVPGPKLG